MDLTNNGAEQFKPKSSSKIKWTDVAPTIRNLPEIQPNTYLRIPPFTLQRTRMPWNMFQRLVVDFDRSVLRVGKQSQLVNKAGVHDYMRPVAPLSPADPTPPLSPFESLVIWLSVSRFLLI
jgi:hypothetical protein